jgi:hypothetical protein
MLENANVIYIQRLGEDAGFIRAAGPVAADRHVDQQIKILVERGGVLCVFSAGRKPYCFRVEKIAIVDAGCDAGAITVTGFSGSEQAKR